MNTRPVAHVGEPLAVLDHLGVVVRAELGLARVALRVDRQEADHVGEERVRRDLALGVLVQEVVDLPRLVADPEVVRRLAHDVVEEHVVGAEDLVHPAERVEGVQVVVGRPRSPSAPTPRPARRWRGARPRRAPARRRETGGWASHSISRSGTRSRRARAMARSRSTWPSPIGEQTHRARRLRSRANSQGVPARSRRGVARGGVHVDELLDLGVHQHRVPGVREVAAALDDARAGPR